MRETRQIVELYQKDRSAAVLMTLVKVTGSSYRRPGAHLLAAAGGEYAGLVSGGCLEAEVLRKAEWLVRAGAVVTHYSTLFDETGEMPYGLGCGGEVDLLLESVNKAECTAWLDAAAASLGGNEMLSVTVLPENEKPLARIVWHADGRCIFASNSLTLATQNVLAEALRDWIRSEDKTLCRRVALPGDSTERRVYAERLTPPQRLIIFGAGKDAQPLVEFAGQLGWHVVVADGRGHLARANRFPQADSVIQLPQFGDPLSALNITQRDAVVLMTHSYEQDRRLLQAVLSSAPRYLGLLGARHRSRLLLRDCAAALGRTVEDYLSQMHVPVGLDLGSDAPESIALSIVAEIQAHLHGRNAGMRTQDDAAEMKLSDDLPQQPIMCQTHLHSNSEEN